MLSSGVKTVSDSNLASRKHVFVAAMLLVASPFARNLISRQGADPSLLAGMETVPCGTANVTLAVQQPASPYCGLVARTPATTPPAWCVPTAPWYYLDNGGNSCVCEQKWDTGMYASKVWLGVGHDIPHTLMNVNLYAVLQSTERTLLASLLNEVIEELVVMVFGVWGFTDLQATLPNVYTMQNLETRYDSLIRDVLLTGLPGIVVGYIVVTCSGAIPFFVGAWPQVVASILMYFVLSEVNALYDTADIVGRLYPGNLAMILIYVVALGGVWRICGRHEPPVLFVYWFAAIAALLLSSVYPWNAGLVRVYYSTAFTIVLLLVMHRLAVQRRARPAGGAGASKASVLLGDVVSGARAPPEKVRGLSLRALYSPYPFLVFALCLVGLAANRFFVAPVRGDAAFALNKWCGMGTASDVEWSRLGGSACAVLKALKAS